MIARTTIALLLLTLFAISARGQQPSVAPTGIQAATVPDRQLPRPEAPGKPYPLPATKWEQRPILWGWTCELPDGSGLAFGGVHQTADDGNPHTRILEDGQWKPIVEELRKANPLQDRYVQVRQLRCACKDALARARHLYFEGKPAEEELKLLQAGVNPAIGMLAKDLAAMMTELRGLNNLGPYEAGQVKFALGHLEVAVGQIQPFAGPTTPQQLATLRRAQIGLEIAAEAFDAEPPPRTCSKIAYEPKTKLFVIFGGEHMDYATNDLWVFDPAKHRWMQRHPAAAPEPRCDAHLEPLGDGRVVMFGGSINEPGRWRTHAGPARWIYDLQHDTWTTDGHREKTFPADSRSVRYWPPAGPENAMQGARPDAAANQARLKALPANAWVRLPTPGLIKDAAGICRDWATWSFDFDRDLFYVWAGGHASYSGNDVARYHPASDRWEISDVPDDVLGCAGTNEQYPSGFSFNLRPWVKKHVWNGQAYDVGLRLMLMGSANDQKLDPYYYVYDPDKADWTGRHRFPQGMGNDAYGLQLRYTRHGMFAWYGDRAWLHDGKTWEWKKLAVEGKMPSTGVDSCGMVYDPKRDRMLLVTLGGYARPFDGQIHALDLKTLRISPLDPAGMMKGGRRWDIFLREVTYHPQSDLFLWISRVKVNGQAAPDRFPAYDVGQNRWVSLRLEFAKGSTPIDLGSVSSSVAWDAKRGLFWVGDSSWAGGIWVLRFDPATVEMTPL